MRIFIEKEEKVMIKKKILITGKTSYIGRSFQKYIEIYNQKNPEMRYKVDAISVRDEKWRRYDFSQYDVVLHLAGIAHQRETRKNIRIYYDVNERLAINIAKKAKTSGVKQFIVLSSMSVYGVSTGKITKNTIPNPKTNYGKSKYNADVKITKMMDEKFKVAILRPPMVYGKGCKGNYQLLRKFALIIPIFPKIKNQRSMIYIDNLSDFIKRIVDNENCGIFLPQNQEYVSTVHMVEMIAESNNKKCKIIGLFDLFIKIGLVLNNKFMQKVFGDLVYEKSDCVNIVSFPDSIKKSEN